MDASQAAIERDIFAVAQISVVPALLRIICESTGMGFAAVARVTESRWVACAVQDDIGMGLRPGSELAAETTLCSDARVKRQPIVIDQASADPVYNVHPIPRMYGIESYVSVPIVLSNGDYFGNLCAVDRRPAKVMNDRTLGMFGSFAELIARQLESEAIHRDKDLLHRQTASALVDERATAELRDQFIAVLGHDLRNPLAAIDATAELLARRSDGDIVRIARRLKASSTRMSRLIDDVLDFARGRLGSGMGVQLREEPRLAAALRDVVSECREAHAERALIADIDIEVPVRCDTARVQQLLSNLVGNALAHGSVAEPIEAEARVEDDLLVIAVRNGGEPIPPQSLKRVFEPFWRPADGQAGGGLGLGLHICSQIVAAHGGTIDVWSTAAQGTCFTVRMPVGGPSSPPPAAAPA